MNLRSFYEDYGKHVFPSFDQLEKEYVGFCPKLYSIDRGEGGGAVAYLDGDEGLMVYTTDDQEGRGESCIAVHLVGCAYCAIDAELLPDLAYEIADLKKKSMTECGGL